MIAPTRPPLVYPDSDGKPMAENMLQWNWMVTIQIGIMDIFQDDPNVLVAGDLLWYPFEGELISVAPDVFVAFGRPKGLRASYKQWEEGHLTPQVVFEILSESNTPTEMEEKRLFYQEQGVEEYYEFDPIRTILKGWIRKGTEFRRIWPIHEGWKSPLLGVHFKVENDLILTKPNGDRFPTPEELNRHRNQAIQLAKAEEERADAAEQRAEAEKQRAEAQKQQADQAEERAEAEQRRADAEKQRADAAENQRNEDRQRNDQLADEIARLRALLAERGGDPA